MASGTMTIQYGSEHISSKATRAVNELNDISGTLGKVRSKLSGMPERSRWGNNLSTASSFLRKKQQQYDRCENALETLKTRNDAFMSKVETTEKRLSAQIKKEYKRFNAVTGIGKTWIAQVMDWFKGLGEGLGKFFSQTVPTFFNNLVKAVCETAVKVKDWVVNAIKHVAEGFYFFNKALLKTVGAIVSVVLTAIAIVTAISIPGVGAVLAVGLAIAGAIAAFDMGVDIAKSWDAFGKFVSGEKAKARELDAMSTGEALFGPDSPAADIYNNVVFAAAVVEVVCSLGTSIAGKTVGLLDDIGDIKKMIEATKIGKWSADAVKGLVVAIDLVVNKVMFKAPEIVMNMFDGKPFRGIVGILDVVF